ncbi:hypothetical protein TSOC_007168 [Tetrabaena socialis]|uniref:Uncharacterized protein n=1 Tax=Tetrabaena socialis TaxID=47790 RepID=A0A2J8A1V6_9CHLO|nr:hypothetical protein TSOC_007168 [Tetrabaena socialis]|eukprot:PNH06493.1 hypothetical protein TSOC_007168 [Tetrabaena socialis]
MVVFRGPRRRTSKLHPPPSNATGPGCPESRARRASQLRASAVRTPLATVIRSGPCVRGSGSSAGAKRWRSLRRKEAPAHRRSASTTAARAGEPYGNTASPRSSAGNPPDRQQLSVAERWLQPINIAKPAAATQFTAAELPRGQLGGGHQHPKLPRRLPGGAAASTASAGWGRGQRGAQQGQQQRPQYGSLGGGGAGAPGLPAILRWRRVCHQQTEQGVQGTEEARGG